jgi:peroxiredoxin Q/BCP
MYGKKYMGIERATFVFDKDFVLIKSWRNVKVKDHVDEVLDFIINQA